MSSDTTRQSEVFTSPQALLAECDRLRGAGQPIAALRLLEIACVSEFDAARSSETASSEAGLGADVAAPASSEARGSFAYSAEGRVDLLLARSAVLCDLGRVEEALAISREARNAAPVNPGAHFGLCFTLYLAERLAESLAELEILVQTAPAYPNAAWLRAGLLRRLRGDRDASVLDAYALVLTVEPGNAYAHIERADVLRACGRYQEARDVYARFQSPAACDDEALRAEAAFKRGCVALALHDNADARNAFQAVLDLAPDYPDAREMLSLVNETG